LNNTDFRTIEKQTETSEDAATTAVAPEKLETTKEETERQTTYEPNLHHFLISYAS
jgi:hypothetical protein